MKTNDDKQENRPWVILTEVSTVVEAEIIAGRLRADGIPATVLSQVDSTRSLTIGGLAIAKVYVPTDRAVEALEILESNDDYFDGEEGSGEGGIHG